MSGNRGVQFQAGLGLAERKAGAIAGCVKGEESTDVPNMPWLQPNLESGGRFASWIGHLERSVTGRRCIFAEAEAVAIAQPGDVVFGRVKRPEA